MTETANVRPEPVPQGQDVRRWCESRFFQVTMAVLTAVHLYVGGRYIGPSELGLGWRLLAWSAVLGAIALVPVAFWVRWGNQRPSWGPTFRRNHFALLGLLFIVLCLLVVRDLALLVAWIAGSLPSGVDRLALERDSNLAIAVLVVAAAAYGVYSALRQPRVRRVAVPVRGLPAALEGLRIVQLTDLHIGPTLKRRFMEGVVARAQSLDPHLVAVTGDLVDGGVDELFDEVAPLERLRAPLGVWFAPGNHDYYSGIEDWLPALERLGVRTLINEHRVLEYHGAALVVAGVTDPQGKLFSAAHVPDVAAAFAGAPDGPPRLLLAHQPKLMAQAEGFDVTLQLSGHTHGGQMFPWNFLVKLAQPVVAGLHATGDGWIYVSRGTGFWGPPLRIGAPSEITLIELTSAG